MKKQEYLPEGTVGQKFLGDMSELRDAYLKQKILQSRCIMCDSDRNLHLKLCGTHAIIPKDETALGIREGTVGDVAIITRVNKSVCFKVTDIGEDKIILSRAAAQKEYLEWIYDNLHPGDIIPARITHLEQFGAFCDIGCGIVSMIPIDAISVSRISHPNSRFEVGQSVFVAIKEIDRQSGRITVSHKELLGTWQQNADKFRAGQTVPGIVRSVEEYGIFIELAPNLAGLSELTQGIEAGDRVSVYIKSIIPQKMKVKLAIVDVTKNEHTKDEIEYMYKDNHMDRWKYSPDYCTKLIETIF